MSRSHQQDLARQLQTLYGLSYQAALSEVRKASKRPDWPKALDDAGISKAMVLLIAEQESKRMKGMSLDELLGSQEHLHRISRLDFNYTPTPGLPQFNPDLPMVLGYGKQGETISVPGTAIRQHSLLVGKTGSGARSVSSLFTEYAYVAGYEVVTLGPDDNSPYASHHHISVDYWKPSYEAALRLLLTGPTQPIFLFMEIYNPGEAWSQVLDILSRARSLNVAVCLLTQSLDGINTAALTQNIATLLAMSQYADTAKDLVENSTLAGYLEATELTNLSVGQGVLRVLGEPPKWVRLLLS